MLDERQTIALFRNKRRDFILCIGGINYLLNIIRQTSIIIYLEMSMFLTFAEIKMYFYILFLNILDINIYRKHFKFLFHFKIF